MIRRLIAGTLVMGSVEAGVGGARDSFAMSGSGDCDDDADRTPRTEKWL